MSDNIFSKKAITIASLWVLGAFGLSQFVRLGSNLIVTRLLEPEMFGLMAVVNIIMYGLNMFTDVGLSAYVIRYKGELKKSMLNTIWTMQVIRGWVILGVISVLVSLLIINRSYGVFKLGDVYGNIDLPFLLIVIGLTVVLRGFNSLAPMVLTRQLKRGKIEAFELLSQVVAALVMITLAWLYHSVWALASAGVVAALMWVILSYSGFSIRHTFAWDKPVVASVFNFGKWVFLASILSYLASAGDRLILAAYMPVAQLGVYSIAFMLTAVVSNTLEHLMSRVLFPILSNAARNAQEKLKEKYYSLRLKQDVVVFFGVGVLIAVSPDLINFLYDERYQEAGWMMQVLAFSLIGVALSKLGLECLMALGLTKIRMQVTLLRASFIIISLPLLFNYYGVVGAIWGVVASNFVFIPLLYIEMRRHKIFSFVREIRFLPVIYIGYSLSVILVGALKS